MANEALDLVIPDIEKELDRLWKSALDKKQQKACLFTLVIYAHDPKRVKYMQELVDTIIDKFPCRVIFIKGNSQDKHYFHVNVSTILIGNVVQKSTVACDQISIQVSQDQLFRVPYLITPHVVPDLPVFLLWGQNPFEENAIFPSLQSIASRVIFDSECSDNLHLFCQEMQENLNTQKMDVIDINWALVSNWRDMLHQLFSSGEKVAELKQIKSIKIEYNQNETEVVQHPEIRAIYLQGWLAARLNWKYKDITCQQNQKIITYSGAANSVEIKLMAQSHHDLPSGGIASIEIILNEGQSYYIGRKTNLSQVVVHASSKLECQLPFTLPLPNVHRGLTFMKEIFYSQPNEHYREMLKVISQIDFTN